MGFINQLTTVGSHHYHRLQEPGENRHDELKRLIRTGSPESGGELKHPQVVYGVGFATINYQIFSGFYRGFFKKVVCNGLY